MFTSFTVKNFRCFRDVTVGRLARVNLIAGMNNTGKTALLEALQIHSYPQDCELPFLVNQLRGTDAAQRHNTDVFRWLFHNRQGSSGLELTSRDVDGTTRALSLWLIAGGTAHKRFPAAERLVRGSFLEGTWNSGVDCLVLKADANGQESFAIGVPSAGGLNSIGNKAPWQGPSVLLKSGLGNPDAEAGAFSELAGANRQGEVVAGLQILEPRLTELTLLLLAGQPILHGKINGLERLVPVPFMGEGVRRTLAMLLALMRARGGRVLIDEIENGIHYSVMRAVWQAVAQAARQADVQVFATTHSYECIQAAHEAFVASGTYDFALHRLDRFDDTIELTTYDQEALEGALRSEMEVR